MIAPPRIFKVMRDTDVTGVSGAGHVADGVVFGDGTTVLRWRSEHRSTAVYASLDDALAIHGHGGATRFEFGPGISEQQMQDLRDGKPVIISGDRDLEADVNQSIGIERKLRLVADEARTKHEAELREAIDALEDDTAWKHKVRIKPSTVDILATVDFRNAVIKIIIEELRKRGGVI